MLGVTYKTAWFMAHRIREGIAPANPGPMGGEGVFSILKRTMVGTYQHCGAQHLQRYLNEFDFRYSNCAKLGVTGTKCTVAAVKGIEGRRLTYRRIGQA
jgi:hypothetical protein